MATLLDILQPIEEKVKQIYNTPEGAKLIYEIETIISELNGGGEISKPFEAYTMQELSVLSGKLSILRASLLQLKDTAFRNMKRMIASKDLLMQSQRDGVVKFLTDKANVEGKKAPTQDDIKTLLEKQMASIQYEIALHEAEVERMNSFWYCIPDILHRIETRIKILEGDRTTSKFYSMDIGPMLT